MSRVRLTRYAWLSIGAAVVTMVMKATAFALTGSVALLSDALETLVNLGAAIVALIALSVGARPPDEDHAYGHGKVEYFSSGVEGTLIVLAAAAIWVEAVNRLLHPQPLTVPGLGILITIAAALINLGVALVLRRVGRQERSIALEADAQHLLSDVWTSAAVVAGVGAVALTGWERLDPIIAFVVGGQLVYAGVQLLRRSTLGLMDTALPPSEYNAVQRVLQQFSSRGVGYHALRTRQAGARAFVSVHIQVPGEWSVQRGHELLEEIESEIRRSVRGVTVFTHLEPAEDPVSWEDQTLDRAEVPPNSS
jgi:cation diffusion facilitator family transporter